MLHLIERGVCVPLKLFTATQRNKTETFQYMINNIIPPQRYHQQHLFSSSTKKDNNEEDKEKSHSKSSTNSMFTKKTQNQIEALYTQAQSLPNVLTISRIASTPILCHFVMTEKYQIAITGCFIAGVTDWLDGYIAKNYNQQTVLGTYLDPFADKILINSIALSLSYVDILPVWSSVLWLVRDVVLVGTAYRMNAIAARERGHAVTDPSRTPLKVTPTFISKVNTVFQFGTIGIGLCLGYVDDVGCSIKVIGLDCDIGVMNGLSYMTGATTLLSGLSYVDGKAMKKSGNTNQK